MPTRERFIVENKYLGLAQNGKHYEVYRFIRNMQGEILAKTLVETYPDMPSAIDKMVEQAGNKQ